MFEPSEASAKPAARAASRSASVQPPSGPMARTAQVEGGATSTTMRRTGADGDSERKILREEGFNTAATKGAVESGERKESPKAGAEVCAGTKNGGRRRRDCWADSTRILCQRAERFTAAAMSDFFERLAATG